MNQHPIYSTEYRDSDPSEVTTSPASRFSVSTSHSTPGMMNLNCLNLNFRFSSKNLKPLYAKTKKLFSAMTISNFMNKESKISKSNISKPIIGNNIHYDNLGKNTHQTFPGSLLNNSPSGHYPESGENAYLFPRKAPLPPLSQTKKFELNGTYSGSSAPQLPRLPSFSPFFPEFSLFEAKPPFTNGVVHPDILNKPLPPLPTEQPRPNPFLQKERFADDRFPRFERFKSQKITLKSNDARNETDTSQATASNRKHIAMLMSKVGNKILNPQTLPQPIIREPLVKIDRPEVITIPSYHNKYHVAHSSYLSETPSLDEFNSLSIGALVGNNNTVTVSYPERPVSIARQGNFSEQKYLDSPTIPLNEYDTSCQRSLVQEQGTIPSPRVPLSSGTIPIMLSPEDRSSAGFSTKHHSQLSSSAAPLKNEPSSDIPVKTRKTVRFNMKQKIISASERRKNVGTFHDTHSRQAHLTMENNANNPILQGQHVKPVRKDLGNIRGMSPNVEFQNSRFSVDPFEQNKGNMSSHKKSPSPKNSIFSAESSPPSVYSSEGFNSFSRKSSSTSTPPLAGTYNELYKYYTGRN